MSSICESGTPRLFAFSRSMVTSSCGSLAVKLDGLVRSIGSDLVAAIMPSVASASACTVEPLWSRTSNEKPP